MIKFADDSEITGKIKNDDDFVYMEEKQFCQMVCLQISVSEFFKNERDAYWFQEDLFG